LQTPEFDRPGPNFYEKHLPEIAKQALLKMPARRWDMVIVDEGQDFPPDWWGTVELLVRPGDAGRLRVMYDANQAVYHAQSDPSKSLEGRVFPLRLNLRNTQSIAKATEPLYSGPPMQAIGPIGEAPVAINVVPAEKAIERSIELIGNLITREGLSSEDIAVLLPDRVLCAKIEKSLNQLRIRTVGAGQQRNGAVVVDTIRRFKGLEALVVLLVVDKMSSEHQELSYVAVSRARSRLFVIGELAGTRLGRAIESGALSVADRGLH
jgi:superfamily I DNA and RNA helicase